MKVFEDHLQVLVDGDKLKLTFQARGGEGIEATTSAGRSLAGMYPVASNPDDHVAFSGFVTPEADFWAEKINERVWEGLTLVSQLGPTMRHTFDVPGPIKIVAESSHGMHLSLKCWRVSRKRTRG